MTSWIQDIVDAVALGSIYSLLAVALVVVYRGNRTLNFAQGELAMFGSFVVYALIGLGVPFLLGSVGVGILSIVVGALLYQFLIRPLRNRPEWAVVLVGAALYLGVNALAGTIWGTDPHPFPSFVPNGVDDHLTVGGARIYYYVIANVGVLAAMVTALYWLTTRTSIGLQMRAVASNPASAELSGIPVDRVLQFSWGIAGLLGAVAGFLTAPITSLSNLMMVEILLYALAAAILGGLDSVAGAAIGGITIAIVTTLLATHVSWIGQDLKQTAAMALIVLVLVFKPSGLLGTAQVSRV